MDQKDNKGFYELKIVVIGTAGTGKTSFVHKWTKDVFEDTYKATIVTEFAARIYEYGGRRYRVQIWDIGALGQDRNRAVAKIFSKDAHGCLILASCDRAESLTDAEKWKKTIEDSSGQIPCVLIENKSDLLSEEERGDLSQLNTTAKEADFKKAFRTSVKTGENISDAMDFLLQHVIESIEKEGDKIKDAQDGRDTIRLDESENKGTEKKCCG